MHVCMVQHLKIFLSWYDTSCSPCGAGFGLINDLARVRASAVLLSHGVMPWRDALSIRRWVWVWVRGIKSLAGFSSFELPPTENGNTAADPPSLSPFALLRRRNSSNIYLWAAAPQVLAFLRCCRDAKIPSRGPKASTVTAATVTQLPRSL